MKEKEDEKDKEKVKEENIARPLNYEELSSFDKIYGNLLVKPGETLTDKELIKLGEKYLTSDRMLELFSKNPEEAYKELSAVKEFNDSMFIKLIVYEEICSKGKFAFKHPDYLLALVKEGSFNLKDPMLLAYAVRLSNEKLALSVTKELVKKGAVLADNILFHSYNNPDITKFLLIEKPSIVSYTDKSTSIDSLIKALKKEGSKFQTTLELLEAAKTGGDDLNIKLDIICPPIFDNDYSKSLFKEYASTYTQHGIEGFKLYNNQIFNKLEKTIKDGGNLKGVSQEFRNYVHKISPEEIVKLLEPFISQDVSSTALTTTTSFSTTSSFEKAFDSSSFSSTSESYTTKTAISPTSSSNSDSLITLSSTTVSLVTEDISTELSGESATLLTGESATDGTS